MTVWPTRKKGRVDNCGVDNGGVNVLLVRLVVSTLIFLVFLSLVLSVRLRLTRWPRRRVWRLCWNF